MSYIRKLDKPHVFPDGRYSYESILAPEELRATYVWVFDAEATGPEGGDYDGRQSVHATKESALHALFDFVYGLGVDPRDTSATIADTVEYKNDAGEVWQICGTVETINGWNAHYGVRRTEVKP